MQTPQFDGSLASFCQHLFTDSWLYLTVVLSRESSESFTGQMEKWVKKVGGGMCFTSSEFQNTQSGYIPLQEIS